MLNLKELEKMSWNKVINKKIFDEMTNNDPNKELYEKVLVQARFKFSNEIEDFDFNEISKMPRDSKFEEEAVFNVPSCYYLQPNMKYRVLEPLTEYQTIIDLKCGDYAKKMLEECDETLLEKLDLKQQLTKKINFAERKEEKILLSYVPLIVKKISDYFKIRLDDISQLNDYINDCLLKVKDRINVYDIRIGGELKRYLWLPLTAQIRETYGNIGGNFRLNSNQVVERTEVYNILQENPYLSYEELAERMGFTVGSKPYYNFLQRLDMYKMWRSDAEEASKENDYYATSSDYFGVTNDIDTQMEEQEKNDNLNAILNFVENNFTPRNFEIFKDYFNINGTYDEDPTYEAVAKKFGTTKQNVFVIIKNIKSSVKEGFEKGLINISM